MNDKIIIVYCVIFDYTISDLKEQSSILRKQNLKVLKATSLVQSFNYCAWPTPTKCFILDIQLFQRSCTLQVQFAYRSSTWSALSSSAISSENVEGDCSSSVTGSCMFYNYKVKFIPPLEAETETTELITSSFI